MPAFTGEKISLDFQDADINDILRLVAEVGKQQPHVSHHLRILREAGLIEGIR